MNTFVLTLFNGHPIIGEGSNLLLIDTGSPITIHTSNNLFFCGREYQSVSNYAGLTITKVSELLGKKITTLLGVDVLNHYQIVFDYQKGTVVFYSQPTLFEGNELSFTTFQGIPIIQMNIGLNGLKFFLDTGARLSYLPQTITKGFKSVGTEVDFYPGLGNFETNCFQIQTTLGVYDFGVKYGNLPALLHQTLMIGGTDGIIGFDFFNSFIVLLDIKNRRLIYKKN